MAIPSVNQFSQQPGGGLVTALGGMNALQQQMLENQIKSVQAQYAPVTVPAEAASKLTYANLMGPQFLAKLMGHRDILAQLPDDKAKSGINMLYNAGTGQPMPGNALLQRMGQGASQQQTLGSFLMDKIKNVFSPKSQQQSQPQGGVSQQDLMSMNSLSPGQSYVVQGNQPQQNMQQAVAPSYQTPQVPSVAQNVGQFESLVQEGSEAGKIRSKNIDELNNLVMNAENNQITLDDMSSILQSPEIEQIRKVPLAGHAELGYYAKFGTPEQKRSVGRLNTLMGNFVKDSARDFHGAFRVGEQALLQSMKPAPGDTVDVMRGKVETLGYLNQMLQQRSKLTADIMEREHISKGKALEKADKQINGAAIRKEIQDKIYPKVTIRNTKTGEKRTVSREEALKMGIPNV